MVLESGAVESFAISGGFLGLMAAVELGVAVVLLAFGSGGTFRVLLLMAWLSAISLIGWL